MKFQPVNKQLKNAKTVTIRQCETSDASPLLQIAKAYHADSDHLITNAVEFNPTIEQETKFIESFFNSENSLLLVALHEGKMIGNIDVTGRSYSKIKHIGYVGMGIAKEWRNQGLGTVLLEGMIDWAKANPMLEILWLRVFANHAAGIALYKKMGFKEIGRLENHIKTEGGYIDDVMMQLKV